jgi:Ca2+-binding RTX toxin-like protein
VLGLSADPAAILTGGAVSNLTASVATNSAGEVKGGGFPDGNAVGFATDLGLIGAQPTTVGGLATSTLTSGDTAGYANVSATLDGQTVTTPVTIGTPPPDDPQPCTNAIKGKKKGDKLVGTAEGDVIKGKAGNDKITGGAGEDCLKGGPGKDKIKSRDGEVDQVNCGPGKDRVKADKVDVVKKNCEKVKAK